MIASLAWPIVLPLAGAVATLTTGRPAKVPVALTATAGTCLAAWAVIRQVWQDGPARHTVGGWGAPLGIDLVADGLTAAMLGMAAVVGGAVSLYAAASFRKDPDARPGQMFWPLWLFLWASLNAVFLSGDAFNVYVALELMTISAVGLLVLAPGPVVLVAAARYLFAAFLASMAYLLGVAILYGAFGALDLVTLGARVTPGVPASAALALTTAALLLKTALFPLHFWLPRAHAHAVTPVSAVLSALVIKASFYAALRLWSGVFADVVTVAAAQLVGALGACAVLWGAVQAVRQTRLKLLVGYSTVSQIGYLFLAFPLAFPAADAGAARDAALAGGVSQALAHAAGKAAMFLSAGLMLQCARTDLIAGLAGVATRLPMAVFAFGLAGVSIAGLPPSGGFVAKWLLVEAALQSGQWWWALVMVAGGLLSAGYLFLVLGHTLMPRNPDEVREGHVDVPVDGSRFLQRVCLGLAVAGLLFGLRGTDVVLLLQRGGS